MIPVELFDFTATQYVLIWSALSLLVLLLCLRPPASVTLVANDQGELRISRHALHRLIETCCEQLRGVATARATVGRRGGKFTVTLRLTVRPNAKLDAIQGYLTQELAEIFKENLGVGEIGRVQVKVVGITRDPAAF
ncbi:MAG: hypothetical protein H2172_10630 [Opitutus sp.]|nr:hypothetical protein [Opitutus sp.]MCS6248042.1 hypothetical protein [Opitutus sp.]MCS6274018.1 hypothetical protein [Opitutus sp.]MCS6276807.1 hypothetical protein [Opitutus sp.]MCS6301544.1 hypothetical protein [Opitutus sp.]